MNSIKKYWSLSAIIILFNVIGYLTLKGDALLYVSDLLPIICSLIAIIGVFFVVKGLKVLDFTKTAWLLILFGLIFDFLAEGIYSILEIVLKWDMNKQFPSYADYFWFTAYIFFFISLSIMLTGYLRSGMPLGKIRKYFLLVILLAGVVIVIVNYLLIPILKDNETEVATKVATLFYPIADTLVVCLAAILMLIINQFDNKIISMPWKLLGLGFIFFTFSDLVYDYLSWKGVYDSGNLIDIGWNFGYLLLGVSGVYQLRLIKSVQERG
jgi:hypothetical protein